MDERELVCLNDGRGTRINVSTGKESVSDITLVSNTLAGNSNWEVWTSLEIVIGKFGHLLQWGVIITLSFVQ